MLGTILWETEVSWCFWHSKGCILDSRFDGLCFCLVITWSRWLFVFLSQKPSIILRNRELGSLLDWWEMNKVLRHIGTRSQRFLSIVMLLLSLVACLLPFVILIIEATYQRWGVLFRALIRDRIDGMLIVDGTRNLIKLLGISKVRFATVADGDLVCSVVLRSSLGVESNT